MLTLDYIQFSTLCFLIRYTGLASRGREVTEIVKFKERYEKQIMTLTKGVFPVLRKLTDFNVSAC